MSEQSLNSATEAVKRAIVDRLESMSPLEVMVMGFAAMGINNPVVEHLYRELDEPETNLDSVHFTMLEAVCERYGKPEVLQTLVVSQ